MKYMINRSVKPTIEETLNDGQVAIVYGARQTGKTTLAREIMKQVPNHLYLTADDPAVIARVEGQSLTSLQATIGDAELVVIDEAQRISNIGLTAKLIHDSMPEKKLLLTGSSSLDLANKVREPLTGRAREIILYPLSLKEVSRNQIEADGYLNRLLVYGAYPGLWSMGDEAAAEAISTIANNNLYKDAFALDTIYDQSVIRSLLVLLAHQVGSEVSYSELASSLEVSKETVMRYIDLLEKAFIVFRRSQYRKNRRVQVGRLRKVYFYDLGVRNALVGNLNPLALRNDIGALWENFCILERMKLHQREPGGVFVRSFYWRSRDKQEVDLIEELSGVVTAFETKWSKQPVFPGGFAREYPEAECYGITKQNYWEYL